MGTVIGHFAVRRSTFIRATPERAWQEFASFEALAAWFGTGHTLDSFEPYEGGSIHLSVELNGEARGFGGRVLVFDLAKELTFEDNWDPPHAWPLPTFITIRLTPVYDGTVVELFHHGFERLGAQAPDLLAGHEGGWDNHHLEKLRATVEA